MHYDRLRILLVDDNAHMRTLLNEILKAVGVRHLYAAADGGAALQLMKGQEIDLVITDLAMRPMDGIEFVKRLRASRMNPNPMTPVIMVTGYSTLQRVSEARDAGVHEFLSKPLTAKAVLERLSRAVQSPRPFVRSMTYLGPDRRRRQLDSHLGPWRRATDPRPGTTAEVS